MRKYIFLIIALPICFMSTAYAQKRTSRVDKSLSIYNDIWRQLDIYYADTLNYDNLLEASINGMLKKVDPYTVYIPEDKTQDLRFMTTGKYGGIGAVIMQRDKQVYVSDPYEGMPAQRNDVRAGDKILEIDGKDVRGKSTSEVSNMLRGNPKSIVTLKLEREGEKKPIKKSFEREEIKISPIPYSSIIKDTKVGYIVFTEFTENSADMFHDALDALVSQGAEALVIDLRDNGGGIIDEAIKIISLFVDKGTEVVSTKGKNKQSNKTYRTPLQPQYKDLPLAVLVNRNSASASEIVSGSLQDLDRATIIGERTYGKGLVQSIRPIAFNGHLKITTSKYYIPSGRCIQAIDYSKRRQDGSVERVPDSLTHVFYTKNGREVRDGGGIEPDIVIKDSAKVDITYALYVKQMFFDYATLYRNTHDSICDPSKFEVSDAELNNFILFLKEKDFKYETETSKYFHDMMEMAQHEDLDSTTIAELKAIEQKLEPSFEDAINRRKQEVKEMLGKEIVSRYYFTRGIIAFGLANDKELQTAIEKLKE